MAYQRAALGNVSSGSANASEHDGAKAAIANLLDDLILVHETDSRRGMKLMLLKVGAVAVVLCLWLLLLLL